tara:strand:- start:1969 stop:3117 length:1149 start_codon:yes stop_codon:yes gene_type:complete
MKKILVVHNKYKLVGGEDIAVDNEILFLSKFYDVETLFFENKINNTILQVFYFLINRNFESKKILRNKINSFNPDVVYVHNTWFKASTYIFKLLKELDIKTIIKIHNFRYFCTRYYFEKNHLHGEINCKACGLKKSNNFINKYFDESFIKSLIVVRYGKKYFNIIKDYNFKLLVLTNFHKNYLLKLGFNEENIEILRNHIDITNEEKLSNIENYLIYAGRISDEKGLEELINSFLKSNLVNTKLKIVGEGPRLKNLKDQYYLNEKIEFLGKLENKKVLDLIRGSLAVVTGTKLFEGQPTILCEASMLGVPSVFPDSGGIKEFFPKTTKLSFESGNFKQLTEKINLLSSEKIVSEESKNNNEYIKKLLDSDLIKKQFEKIINE